MEIYQLKVFLQVARYLSFTEAAHSLNLTQPAVSAKIKSLESDIGSPLFHRLGRKVQLTEIGHFLLEGASDLVEQESVLHQKLEDYKNGCRGELYIACSTAISSGFISDIIFNFREQNPEINLHLKILSSSQDIYHAITASEVDFAISEISFADTAEVHCEAISSTEYSAICGPRSPWSIRNCISLNETIGEPWVLNRQDVIARSIFESRLSDIGLGTDDLAKVEIVETENLMRTYILSGGYLGFSSKLSFQAEVKSAQLISLPIHEFTLPSSIFIALSSKKFYDLKEKEQAIGMRGGIESPTQKMLKFLEVLSVDNRGVDSTLSANKLPALTMEPPAYTTSLRTVEKTESLQIRIGIQNRTLPAASGGIIMQKLGLFKHYLPKSGRYASSQYSIQWQDFDTGMPIVNGLHSRQLDLGILGDYPMLLSALRNEQIANGEKIAAEDDSTILIGFVAINPDGCRNAVIVPQHSNLNEIEDLCGQVLAIPDGSTAHGMVLRVLHQHGLLSEVELLPVSNSLEMRRADRSIAGYAYFSPFHELALERNKFRYLFDGNVGGLPAFYGVVARKGFAREHPDLVVSYLKGLKAAQHWQSTVPSASQKLSQWTQNSPHIIDSIIGTCPTQDSQGLYFPDTQIREDWILDHISHYQLAANDREFSDLHLSRWVDEDFMATAMRN
ncbi:MAG: LysR family transcriptional regulator [Synechococcus sp.]